MAKKKITCKGCGDTFEVYPYRADTASYCSRKCRRSRTMVTCETCEEEFETHEYREDSARFCSYECKGEWQSEEMVGENAPHYHDGKEEFVCEWCGDVFFGYTSVGGHNGRFCSTSCYGSWRSENLVGEDNPLYKDGSGPNYPSGWKDIREDVLERDNYRCQTCGLSEEAHVVMFGRSLDVHHVVARRRSKDDSPSNLISLCRTCHRRLENRTQRP